MICLVRYEIHVPADVLQLGSPDETKGNGSWTGVLGQLLRDVRNLFFILFLLFFIIN